jgi:hypothetical protein
MSVDLGLNSSSFVRNCLRYLIKRNEYTWHPIIGVDVGFYHQRLIATVTTRFQFRMARSPEPTSLLLTKVPKFGKWRNCPHNWPFENIHNASMHVPFFSSFFTKSSSIIYFNKIKCFLLCFNILLR